MHHDNNEQTARSHVRRTRVEYAEAFRRKLWDAIVSTSRAVDQAESELRALKARRSYSHQRRAG